MSGEGHTESKALTPQRRSAPLTFAVVVYVTDGRGGTKCDHAEGYNAQQRAVAPTSTIFLNRFPTLLAQPLIRCATDVEVSI
jgi:hypothetical protein